MRLVHLKLINFKNYEAEKVSFSSDINLLYGSNGSGKTNLLDAINYLALGKSYFGLSDKHLVKDEQDFLRVEGTLSDEYSKSTTITIKYQKGQKKEIVYQKRKLKTASEIVGKIPVVLIAPNDIKLVNDDSKERRDFVNRILCQSDQAYLQNVLMYNRVLNQKNALLKAEGIPDRLVLESYNKTLIQSGLAIFNLRKLFIEEYIDFLKGLYSDIAGNKENVHLSYQSQYNCEDVYAAYARLIEKEILIKRPLIGIHKDDFEFTIGDKEMKKYGSQGQIKTFLYALRIAEYFYLWGHLQMKPILILDDFFEKLDKERLTQLISLINNDTFNQVFLSDTELERSAKIFEKNNINFTAYHIKKGRIINPGTP